MVLVIGRTPAWFSCTVSLPDDCCSAAVMLQQRCHAVLPWQVEIEGTSGEGSSQVRAGSCCPCCRQSGFEQVALHKHDAWASACPSTRRT